MPLYRPSSESIRHSELSDKTGAQLRQRKVLPPLASPPTELSMAALDPAHDVDDDESKADVEQMLRNHSGFARAFKLNDAAMLLPFLDKDVVLHTHDGAEFEGVSAVLGCLVGPKMTKLSSALHVKGRPMRSASWQTAFVYEHGLVFREPLYSEVVDWKPHAGVITRITHTRLSNPNDVGPPKSVSDVVKVVATLPHRLSLSDDDDNAVSKGRRSSCTSRASLTAINAANSPTASGDVGVLVTRIAVLTKLTPIRKRKIVNAFITVEDDAGRVVWKSTVAKKQTLPVWSGVDLAIPPLIDEDMNLGNQSRELLQYLANAHTPVTVTLWDYGFFRSLRVATTQVTAAQLLRDERAGLTSIELKPMGLSAHPVQLSFSIVRQEGDTDWRPRRSSVVSTVAAIDAALGIDESSTAVVQKAPGGFDGTFVFVSGFSLLVVLCCVLIWQRMLSPLVAE